MSGRMDGWIDEEEVREKGSKREKNNFEERRDSVIELHSRAGLVKETSCDSNFSVYLYIGVMVYYDSKTKHSK